MLHTGLLRVTSTPWEYLDIPLLGYLTLLTLQNEGTVRTHWVSLAPDAKLAHLNRKPNTCHSAKKKRKSLPSQTHSSVIQKRLRSYQEAANVALHWFPLCLKKGKKEGFRLEPQLMIVLIIDSGDFFKLFQNNLPWYKREIFENADKSINHPPWMNHYSTSNCD